MPFLIWTGLKIKRMAAVGPSALARMKPRRNKKATSPREAKNAFIPPPPPPFHAAAERRGRCDAANVHRVRAIKGSSSRTRSHRALAAVIPIPPFHWPQLLSVWEDKEQNRAGLSGVPPAEPTLSSPQLPFSLARLERSWGGGIAREEGHCQARARGGEQDFDCCLPSRPSCGMARGGGGASTRGCTGGKGQAGMRSCSGSRAKQKKGTQDMPFCFTVFVSGHLHCRASVFRHHAGKGDRRGGRNQGTVLRRLAGAGRGTGGADTHGRYCRALRSFSRLLRRLRRERGRATGDGRRTTGDGAKRGVGVANVKRLG